MKLKDYILRLFERPLPAPQDNEQLINYIKRTQPKTYDFWIKHKANEYFRQRKQEKKTSLPNTNNDAGV